jgi:hypothetical protein
LFYFQINFLLLQTLQTQDKEESQKDNKEKAKTSGHTKESNAGPLKGCPTPLGKYLILVIKVYMT